jgi:hypothetical protein
LGKNQVFFDPRPLRNLSLIDEMPSICPLMDLQVRLWIVTPLTAKVFISPLSALPQPPRTLHALHALHV